MANFLRPISHYIPIFRVTRLWSSGPPLPGDGKIPFQYFTAYALSLVAVARRVVNTGGKQARAKPRFSWGLVAPFPIRWTTGREETADASVGLLRITKLVVPHRMPKVRVPDTVRPNYPDASP